MSLVHWLTRPKTLKLKTSRTTISTYTSIFSQAYSFILKLNLHSFLFLLYLLASKLFVHHFFAPFSHKLNLISNCSTFVHHIKHTQVFSHKYLFTISLRPFLLFTCFKISSFFIETTPTWDFESNPFEIKGFWTAPCSDFVTNFPPIAKR